MSKSKGDRHNAGKLRWGLVDWDAIKPMVRVLEFGAQKYADHNWKKGLSRVEVCESLMRHLTAYMNGEDKDPESGISHIGHIQCNAMFLGYGDQFQPDLDDRFKDENKTCCGRWNELGECNCKRTDNEQV